MSKQTVTINGTMYDAHTGMPVGKAEPVSPQATPVVEPAPTPTPKTPRDSHAVHHVTQKSQTLRRQIVKKAPQTPQVTPRQTTQPRPTVQKSPAITKFAPHPSPSPSKTRMVSDIGPMPHPMAVKAHNIQKQQAQASAGQFAPKPSQVIKQEAITQAIENAPSHSKNHEPIKTSKKRTHALSIASASLALLLLGGYFTYLNMPSLSVRVAAAQSGVDASYPEYRPDGYSLKGSVAYTQNEVMMKFGANGGPQSFSINQAKSSWDSTAVLNNYVKKKAGDSYITYNERGLTIYTFDGNAAWVNGGILYTINGDAPLSSDQIRRIATSM